LPTTIDEAPLLYDRRRAASALSISIRSLDTLLAQGCFQTRRIGRKVLITQGSLRQFARGDHFGPLSGAKKASTTNTAEAA